jgi:AhpD family alkylhydroperoxidase
MAPTQLDGRMYMSEYLPEIYRRFRKGHPTVARALDRLGVVTKQAGPLDERTQQLVKLGISIAGSAEGAVRSHTRRALEAGATPEEVQHVALLAISTSGFPTAIAGLGWMEEVLAR